MNTIKSNFKKISGMTSQVVVAAAVISFIFPNLFAWVSGTTQTLILGLIMLSMGMSLTSKDFEILAKRPLDILIGCFAQYTVMPLLAFSISRLLNLPDEIAIGLILVGCCPGGVSSNIMSFLCKGDVAFSVGMTTVSTLIAPVLTPLLVLRLAGQAIDVNAQSMFISILQITIIPIILGFMLNRYLSERKWFGGVKEIMPSTSVIGLALIVAGVIAAVGDQFFSSGLLIFLAIFIHNTTGYAIGYLIGVVFKMSTAKKRTISIEIGMQNAGLATNLASAHFAAYPLAAVACAVSCVWHSISGTLLAGIYIHIDKVNEKKLNTVNLNENEKEISLEKAEKVNA